MLVGGAEDGVEDATEKADDAGRTDEAAAISSGTGTAAAESEGCKAPDGNKKIVSGGDSDFLAEKLAIAARSRRARRKQEDSIRDTGTGAAFATSRKPDVTTASAASSEGRGPSDAPTPTPTPSVPPNAPFQTPSQRLVAKLKRDSQTGPNASPRSSASSAPNAPFQTPSQRLIAKLKRDSQTGPNASPRSSASSATSTCAEAAATAAATAAAATDNSSSGINEKKHALDATRNMGPKTAAALDAFRVRRKGSAAATKSVESAGGKGNAGKTISVKSGKAPSRPKPETISVQEPPHPEYYQAEGQESEEEKQGAVSADFEGEGRRTSSSKKDARVNIDPQDYRNAAGLPSQNEAKASVPADVTPGAVAVAGPVSDNHGSTQLSAAAAAAAAASMAPLDEPLTADGREEAATTVTAYAVTDGDVTDEAHQLVRRMLDEAIIVNGEKVDGDPVAVDRPHVDDDKLADGDAVAQHSWRGRIVMGALALALFVVIFLALGLSGVFENNNKNTKEANAHEACDAANCWVQLGQDLTSPTLYNEFGEEVLLSDEFGEEVSLSGSGSRLAVSARLWAPEGALYEEEVGEAGAVWVYDVIEDDGSVSFAEVGEFYGQGGDQIRGYLSRDGQTIGIGARFRDGLDGTDDVGLASFYEMADSKPGGWTEFGEPLYGQELKDMCGKAIALSRDGSIMAVTSPSHSKVGGNGTVRVYKKTKEAGSGIWVPLGPDVIGEASNDQFGWSVSLSDDGSVLAVGARHNGVSKKAGQVRVYRLSPGRDAWIQLGTDIDGEAQGDKFGGTCMLSGDGMTVAAGAWFNNGANGTLSDSGHIRVFVYDERENEWLQIGNAIEGDDRDDRLGQVSLSADGRRLAAGSVGETKGDTGYVRVYTYGNVGSGWRQVGGTLMSDRTGDNYGMSVSLSEDGTRLAVGSPSRTSDDFRAGYVRLYTLRAL